jgi:hypothetical protein
VRKVNQSTKKDKNMDDPIIPSTPADSPAPVVGPPIPEKPKDDNATKLIEAFKSGMASAETGDVIAAAAHARRALLIAEPESAETLDEPRGDGIRRKQRFGNFRVARTEKSFSGGK